MNGYGILDLLKLCHHILINVKTAGCIKDNKVIAVFLSVLQSSFCNVRRLMVLAHGKDFYALFFSVNLQLFDRCRTVYITGYKKRFLAF